MKTLPPIPKHRDKFLSKVQLWNPSVNVRACLTPTSLTLNTLKSACKRWTHSQRIDNNSANWQTCRKVCSWVSLEDFSASSSLRCSSMRLSTLALCSLVSSANLADVDSSWRRSSSSSFSLKACFSRERSSKAYHVSKYTRLTDFSQNKKRVKTEWFLTTDCVWSSARQWSNNKLTNFQHWTEFRAIHTCSKVLIWLEACISVSPTRPSRALLLVSIVRRRSCVLASLELKSRMLDSCCSRVASNSPISSEEKTNENTLELFCTAALCILVFGLHKHVIQQGFFPVGVEALLCGCFANRYNCTQVISQK